MGKLGNRFYEIGKGYEMVSAQYKSPYIIGVDINDKEKPFLLAYGDHHSDLGVITVSLEDLLFEKRKEHILKSNCKEFIDELKKVIDSSNPSPPKFLVNNE
ncbi:hypothetical protein [Tenacibaculum ovolyticum]|uniref:hypothetical protein n=1 Tax=Tenacibaculum ovolyticum TaxID=104270 RepID=UPI001F36D5A8|nr:hypothetical protein [Tenacibaculum ovolyticum]